jgi:ABC-type transport system involved in multi-copper enzyme maturation permease subunit
MTATVTSYRSTVQTGRSGFGQALRAEWTKFRTVRGWLIATAVAVLVMVGLGWLTGAGSHSTYNNGPGTPDIVGHPYVPVGPDGEAVSDRFTFVHRALDGDGSLTVRVTSLTGAQVMPDQNGPSGPGQSRPAPVQPWAKAGLIVKESTKQGSAYAAIMVTGEHGVRMQYNFTGDKAGPTGTVSAGSPRWLRLTRTGDTLTGYASADGSTWTAVGSVRLAGLPATVQAGLFAASPLQENVTQHLGGGGRVTGGPSRLTARFDNLDTSGGFAAGNWTGTAVGETDAPDLDQRTGFQQDGDAMSVTGSGDIAPDVAGSGDAMEQTLAGVFGTLTVMVVLGVLFMTGEYRRGMIRTSLAASPRRGRVLAAKAVVVGTVTLVVGLVATAVTVPLSEHILRTNGNFVYPVSGLTQVRVIAGTAALLAVAAVLALAVGTILRRSAGAVATVILLIVLPYILATAGVLPPEPSRWLLRLTPAAGFAIQQSLPAYPQLSRVFTPAFGFYPLAPWAGFAVLCGWAALALAAAGYLLRRRDV